MVFWQQIVVSVVFFFNIFLFLKSRIECQRKNSFGLVRRLSFLGMFVWGDVLILAPFWMIISSVSLLLNDWLLFILFVSAFWLVRSLGETLYWFLQQFAVVKRDPPESLAGYRFVKNESIWFMYQVMWQCITVISLVATIFFAHRWLQFISA